MRRCAAPDRRGIFRLYRIDQRNMPIYFLRGLTGKNRTEKANCQLGVSLAFVAGAANAGGFLAVKQYTSHMTGIISSLADNLALGDLRLLLAGLSALLAFMAGAASSAILVNWARRRRMQSEYALPLLIESVLMLGFGLLGAHLAEHVWLFMPLTAGLLCYMMGLQNAIITKVSKAEIRTTHVTGLITDFSIELGKLFYWNSDHDTGRPAVLANRDKLKLLLLLLGAFFLGGALGAVGFKHAGFVSTVPLSLFLMLLAMVPVLDDVMTQFGRRGN